jgi:23S rRNA (uracil1939-C5)-methyltransferase
MIILQRNFNFKTVGRRRKKLPIVKDLLITDIGAEGQAIGKHDDFVIFVRGVISGDIVDVQLTRKRKSYAESRLLKIKKQSEDRIDHFCEHFLRCGGCKWQMLPYDKQLYYKQKQVFDQFTRIGKLEFPEIKPIIRAENDKFYRNKLEFTFGSRKWIEEHEPEIDKSCRLLEGLGFHVQGMFDRIIDIKKCWLQADPSNEIRNKIREFTRADNYDYYNSYTHTGFMRNLIIRTTSTGETMIVVIFAEDDAERINPLMQFLKNEFPQTISLQYAVNTKKNDSIYDLDIICFSGRDYIIEKINGMIFKIGAKSFFQTNTAQATQLYNMTLEYALKQNSGIAYDLYTGTGTIANFIAPHFEKVIGIDSVPDSISDAKLNSELNSITNTTFYAGDMKDILTNEFVQNNGKPDTIILDPPRAGVHQNVIEVLRQTAAKTIVYVSCNPATQARDISLLADMYKIEEVQPIDMFPHTHHVENIVFLNIRSNIGYKSNV